MSIRYADVEFEFNGETFHGDCKFYFEPEEVGNYSGRPEDCEPGSAAVYDPEQLTIAILGETIDCTWYMSLIIDDLVKQLKVNDFKKEFGND